MELVDSGFRLGLKQKHLGLAPPSIWLVQPILLL